MTIDPRIYDLAQELVATTLKEIDRPVAFTERELTQRVTQAAHAIQQAIEDECEQLRQEWSR